MRIRLVTVGRVKERYLQEGIREYLKRLGPYARVEVVTVPDEPIPEGAAPAQEEQVKQREGERILRVLGQGGQEHVVVLDGRGKNLSSEELAAFLSERALHGEPNLAFVVGGSLGLAREVLERADTLLSLGRMTFLHQMVPLIVLEQIYRGFKINRGEKYHK